MRRRDAGRGTWTAFQVRGIPVRLHVSMLLVIPVLALAFAGRFRVLAAEGALILPPFAWGLVIAVALFISVLAHELAHALVARAMGLTVRAITLILIGGMSELAGPPPPPRREALIAVVGPLCSLLLGGGLFAIAAATGAAAADVHFAVRLLAVLNVALGIFNLVPAFPLDGGRVLRALLALRLGRAPATRAAAAVGKVLAIGLGLLGLQLGDLLAMVVAVFIYFGADREAAGVALEEAVQGLRVGDVLSTEPVVALPVRLSVADAAVRMLAARADAAAVMSPLGAPLGAISARELHAVPGAARREVTLADLVPAEPGTVDVAELLSEALMSLGESRSSAVPVVDEAGNLLGLLRRRDVDRELALREVTRERRERAARGTLELQTR